MHELSMLWELEGILPRMQASTETSAFVESFGIHLRNLIDFFYEGGRNDDVTARDFLDAPTAWTPNTPERLEKARIRVNKELSHLTQSRKSGSPPEKKWETVALLKDIDVIAKDFSTKSPGRSSTPKCGSSCTSRKTRSSCGSATTSLTPTSPRTPLVRPSTVRGTHRPPRRSSPKPRCSSPSRLRNNLIAARPPGTVRRVQHESRSAPRTVNELCGCYNN